MFSKWRKFNHNSRKTVEKVFSEFIVFDTLKWVFIAGRNNPYIHFDIFLSTNPLSADRPGAVSLSYLLGPNDRPDNQILSTPPQPPSRWATSASAPVRTQAPTRATWRSTLRWSAAWTTTSAASRRSTAALGRGGGGEDDNKDEETRAARLEEENLLILSRNFI